MDAEDLDLPTSAFTVVLCAFGVFFLPDPERAVAEFYRVLRPGGRLGLSTWGEEDDRWAWEDELFADLDVTRRAVVRPFDDPGELEELLTGAGFEDVAVDAEDYEMHVGDEDEWWRWKWSYSLRGVLEQLSPEQFERVRREVTARFRDMGSHAAAPVRLRALLATGRRPT